MSGNDGASWVELNNPNTTPNAPLWHNGVLRGSVFPDFCSNFSSHPITLKDKEFQTAEHAFQSLKAVDPEDAERIRLAPTPGKAKVIARGVALRPDWENIKVSVMFVVVTTKFVAHPRIMGRLQSTTGRIVERNSWHDCFWGVCECPQCSGAGFNALGSILEVIRGFPVALGNFEGLVAAGGIATDKMWVPGWN